jgi:hypothetical protein
MLGFPEVEWERTKTSDMALFAVSVTCATMSPDEYIEWAAPNPPVTINAPVVLDVLAVVGVTLVRKLSAEKEFVIELVSWVLMSNFDVSAPFVTVDSFTSIDPIGWAPESEDSTPN